MEMVDANESIWSQTSLYIFHKNTDGILFIFTTAYSKNEAEFHLFLKNKKLQKIDWQIISYAI